jgi:hypothetical protein
MLQGCDAAGEPGRDDVDEMSDVSIMSVGKSVVVVGGAAASACDGGDDGGCGGGAAAGNPERTLSYANSIY